MTDALKKEIEDYIFTNPHGWCSLEKALAMAELIVEVKPSVVVEIGVFGGRSLIPQAMALRENGHGVIFGIDPWRNENAIEGNLPDKDKDWWRTIDLEAVHRSCMDAIWSRGLNSKAVIIRAASNECAHLFDSISILHIDGTHSEEASCRDVDLFAHRVTLGGFLWMDDVAWPTVRKAAQKLDGWMTKVKEVSAPDGACALYKKPTISMV